MKSMKKLLLYPVYFLSLLIIPFSCKKFIQQQEQNAIINLVTNGTWRITRYLDYQNIDITDSFSQYSFQFNKNGTIYGTRYGQQTNGTWTADVSNKTITSNFPAAAYPISMLNYVWTITDSYTDSVAAKTPVNSSFNVLNLRKN
jgi:hypothetical protein